MNMLNRLLPESSPPELREGLAVCDNLKLLAHCPDETFDLIVTSPPYNIGKAYEQRRSLSEWHRDQARVIHECVRTLKEGGSICWQVGNHVDEGEVFPLDMILYDTFKSLHLKLRNRIVWTFGHGLHCSKRLSGRHETILWFTKGDDYTFNLDSIRIPSKYPNKRHFKGPRAGELSGNPLGKNPTDVWEIPNVKSNHVEKTIHPCQFPVELVERLVLALTDPGGKVFDPYAGVGSSLVAAELHDRVGVGCDIKQQYVEIGRERVRAAREGRIKTRPMGKPIYDPAKPRGGH